MARICRRGCKRQILLVMVERWCGYDHHHTWENTDANVNVMVMVIVIVIVIVVVDEGFKDLCCSITREADAEALVGE